MEKHGEIMETFCSEEVKMIWPWNLRLLPLIQYGAVMKVRMDVSQNEKKYYFIIIYIIII
jgi:hypothetical protein